MQILLIHQNFPGQFKHLGPALVQRGHQVSTLTMQSGLSEEWNGVKVFLYKPMRSSTPNIHPWVVDFETKIIRAEAAFRAALQLKQQGYQPDLIIAHPGWGESLFLKEVWPEVKLAIYCEFYYLAKDGDVDFDPEFFDADPGESCRINIKNLNNLIHFQQVDAAISPTHWQASTFPLPFRDLISVIHDGIDTQAITPNPHIKLTLDNGVTLSKNDEVITYVARNLEPYRGFHTFMRALPYLLKQRPNARIMIVGHHDISYGQRPADGRTWRQVFTEEVSTFIEYEDWQRVHFLGNLPYQYFHAVLQLSSVHVYLTYPFVLSWSLLEAMSCSCAIVASDTKPLREVIQHDQNGRLVDFFDAPALAAEIGMLLDNPEMRQRLGEQARAFAVANYDLNTVCLPKQLAWVDSLLTG